MTSEDLSTSENMIQSDLSDISDDIIEKGVNLFSVFSNEDALRIFLYAKQGIVSSTKAVKDLNLTQKRYYTRIKGLLDAGLLEKIEGIYEYTALGKIIHKMGLYLIGVLNNIDRIELLHDLKTMETLTPFEINRIENMIFEHSNLRENAINSIIGQDSIRSIENLTTYEELVKRVVEVINISESYVLVATNYFDARVMDASLKAVDRGVDLKVLFSKENLSNRLKKLNKLFSPKLMIAAISFLNSSLNITDSLREGEIPFSFVIIDDNKCFFELPKITCSDFSIAFYVSNKITAQRFKEFYYKLWEKGEKHKMIKYFENLKDR